MDSPQKKKKFYGRDQARQLLFQALAEPLRAASEAALGIAGAGANLDTTATWLAVVLAAVVVFALLNRSGDDETPVVQDTPTQTKSTKTTPTEPTTEATTEETTTAPATVQVDDSSYQCNVDYRDAVSDLQAKGLQVSYEQDPTANDGSCAADTVSRFSRNGTLNEGDSIIVYYWGPEPTEPTTPTEPTQPTEPTDTASTDGGLLGQGGV